jgi:hypothetical protein
MKKLLLLLISCFASAHAAEIRISNATAAPGQAATIDVSHVGGDGTRALEVTIVFDDSKLNLPVSSGSIPNAGQNGAFCIRQSSNKVLVASTTVPAGSAPLCRLPFQVLPSARPGLATVSGISAICYGANGAPLPRCAVQNGSVRVSGSSPIPPTTLIPNFQYLYVLLSAAPGAPTVQQLAAFNFSSGLPAPLTGLNVQSPRLAGGYLPTRARGAVRPQR